jgi:hypothetical protein
MTCVYLPTDLNFSFDSFNHAQDNSIHLEVCVYQTAGTRSHLNRLRNPFAYYPEL